MSDEEPNTQQSHSKLRAWVGIGVALASAAASYYALDAQPQFTGTNAVSFSALGSVIGLLIYYGDKIESIKSNYFEIKLRAAAEEAEKTVAETKRILESLRNTRRSMFKSAIHGITHSKPTLTIIYGDLRVERLSSLIKDIKEQGSYEDVRSDIADGAWRLMEDQAQMAREFTNLYGEAESSRFGFFQPVDLLKRANAERERRERDRIDDDDTGHAVDTIRREVSRLFEIYKEAQKSPSE